MERVSMVAGIMDFEGGELTPAETVELFAMLVKSGMAWRLQGFYGRMAVDLIESGLISEEGEVL